MKATVLALALMSCASSYAQTVGVGTSTPNNHAILDVHVPDPTANPQGMMLPNLSSAQRTSMSLGAADEGMIVYDTDSNSIFTWDGSSWQGGGTSSGSAGIDSTGVGFHVERQAGIQNFAGSLVFDKVDYDNVLFEAGGNNFDLVLDEYIVPEDGDYFLQASFATEGLNGTVDLYICILVNSQPQKTSVSVSTGSGATPKSTGIATILRLSAGDSVHVEVAHSSNGNMQSKNANSEQYVWFNGYKMGGGSGSGGEVTPSGYVKVNDELYIEEDENSAGPLNWHDAVEECGEDDAHLCSYQEWYFAAKQDQDSEISLSNMVGNDEWISNLSGGGSPNLIGQSDITSLTSAGFASLNAFRCCKVP